MGEHNDLRSLAHVSFLSLAMKRAREEDDDAERRPADRIHKCDGWPKDMPRGARVFVGTSAPSLSVVHTVAWMPQRCVLTERGLRAFLAELDKPAGDPARLAVMEWVLGGPEDVQHWGHLPAMLKRATRSEVGLVRLRGAGVHVHTVQSDEEEEEEDF